MAKIIIFSPETIFEKSVITTALLNMSTAISETIRKTN